MALNSQPPVLGLQGVLGVGAMTEVDPRQKSEDEWITRARSAWVQMTDWFDASVRAQIRKNIANFRSMHPEGSKYLHPSFRARTKTFRPKTRALGRRVEAAVAVAMFATSDLVSIKPYNQNDPGAVARAKIKQKLLQYRLEQDETWWFLTCIGAAQDGYVAGVIISHQYWSYKSFQDKALNVYRYDYADGTSKFDVKSDAKTVITENRPACDLVPIERFRIDPACDWRDPIHSSPVLCHEHPTYLGEIKEQIKNGTADAIDPTQSFDDQYWWAIASDDYDSIRMAREGARIDKYADKKAIPDSQTINVRKHIQRIEGRDWYWETLSDVIMLRSPRPLTECFVHLKEGARPYVMGLLVAETHKAYPSAPVQLFEGLQEELNDQSNLTQDAVKMATFGRFEVRRNSTVDVATLKSGVPQSVIAVDAIGKDIGELKQRDVPPSAFQTSDRLQVDLDDVSGGMTQATAAANKALNTDQTLGATNLLEGQAGQIRELEMRLFVKTWAEPVLQQFHDMQAVYESDEQVLNDVAVGGGISVQDVMTAMKERTRVALNIGFNATTPEKRINRVTLGIGTIFKLFPQAQQLASMSEVTKEIMGALGYDDGERFFPNPNKEDPQVAALKQQVQQLMAQLAGKQMEMQTRKEIAEIGANARVQVATITGQVQYDIALIVNRIETNRAYLESIDRQIASAENDLHSQELELERVALAHSINQDQADLALKMHQAIVGSAVDSAKAAAPAGDKPPVVPVSGGDKAGTLARGDYGQIPFQPG